MLLSLQNAVHSFGRISECEIGPGLKLHVVVAAGEIQFLRYSNCLPFPVVEGSKAMRRGKKEFPCSVFPQMVG